MFSFLRHRRDGLVRISLALAFVVTTLSFIKQQEVQVAAESSGPTMFQTKNAQYRDCSSEQMASKLGKFGCAVLTKPTAKIGSVRFLSANVKSPNAEKGSSRFSLSADWLPFATKTR